MRKEKNRQTLIRKKIEIRVVERFVLTNSFSGLKSFFMNQESQMKEINKLLKILRISK